LGYQASWGIYNSVQELISKAAMFHSVRYSEEEMTVLRMNGYGIY
jgi:hypothetical protein